MHYLVPSIFPILRYKRFFYGLGTALSTVHRAIDGKEYKNGTHHPFKVLRKMSMGRVNGIQSRFRQVHGH